MQIAVSTMLRSCADCQSCCSSTSCAMLRASSRSEKAWTGALSGTFFSVCDATAWTSAMVFFMRWLSS